MELDCAEFKKLDVSPNGNFVCLSCHAQRLVLLLNLPYSMRKPISSQYETEL